MPSHTTVSRREWIEARKAHLAREKEFTRLRDQLSAERRALPWVRVDKAYVFEGPEGKATLADLFDGRRQLIVYHFMFGPGWEEGCPSCSFLADHIDGAAVHLAQRDVTLLAVSRAPLRQIEAFKRRMGWRFTWVSSHGTDFNFDYRVSFTKEEIAKGAVDYNFGLREFPSEEAPASASSTRTSTATGSTRIPPTRADSTCWSARTITSTWRRRDAARAPWPSRWRGCATTIDTATERAQKGVRHERGTSTGWYTQGRVRPDVGRPTRPVGL